MGKIIYEDECMTITKNKNGRKEIFIKKWEDGESEDFKITDDIIGIANDAFDNCFSLKRICVPLKMKFSTKCFDNIRFKKILIVDGENRFHIESKFSTLKIYIDANAKIIVHDEMKDEYFSVVNNKLFNTTGENAKNKKIDAKNKKSDDDGKILS